MVEPPAEQKVPMPTRPSRRDGVWAIATCVAVALASFGAWHSLELVQAEHQRKVTLQFARSLGSEIQWRLNDQIQASRRLARFWRRFGRQTWEEWEFDTRLYLEDNGLDSVVWVDPGFMVRNWEVGLGTPMKPARAEDLAAIVASQEKAARDGVETFAGPFLLEGGEHAHWTMVPIGKGGAALVAGRRLDAMFDSVLRTHAEQCDVRIRDADDVLFERRSPDCHSSIQVETPIHAFAGRIWTLTIEPSPSIVDVSNPLSYIVLVGGLLTATLLGSVMWTRGVTRAGAVALVGANRRLERTTLETHHAEMELRKLNDELESRVRGRTAALKEAVADLEAFNYSVSHDLRSPLGAIVNFAAIIEQDEGERLEEEGRLHLERIRASAMTALAMMDSLMEFSKAGRLSIETRRVSMRRLVEEVWNELVTADPKREAEIRISELPDVVADPTLLRLVIANLLSNALKFSAVRPKTIIEIGGSRKDGECVIWVKDNGVGFRMESSERIFKVFTRLHPASRYPGTGVGLAIVSRIIGRHDGRVWCEGSPDGGATFYFTLPSGVNA